MAAKLNINFQQAKRISQIIKFEVIEIDLKPTALKLTKYLRNHSSLKYGTLGRITRDYKF